MGRKIEALKSICGEEEVELAKQAMGFSLLILGVKLGTAAGPNVKSLIEAGPALMLQEFGNLGTMILGLPIAIALGMKREVVGATVSICREPTLGLINNIYGPDSQEAMGTMGTKKAKENRSKQITYHISSHCSHCFRNEKRGCGSYCKIGRASCRERV